MHAEHAATEAKGKKKAKGPAKEEEEVKVEKKDGVDRDSRQPKLVTGGVMRTYQIEGMVWMMALYENGLNGILADEVRQANHRPLSSPPSSNSLAKHLMCSNHAHHVSCGVLFGLRSGVSVAGVQPPLYVLCVVFGVRSGVSVVGPTLSQTMGYHYGR